MSTAQSDHLWREIHEIMRYRHIAHGHDEVDSLNRLLSRSPWARDGRPPFRITRQNSSVVAETWDLDRLWQLVDANPSLKTDTPPAASIGAVVVARWGGTEYLLDGRRRINQWKRNSIRGPHRVLLVTEART
jgi:hypothetical protein